MGSSITLMTEIGCRDLFQFIPNRVHLTKRKNILFRPQRSRVELPSPNQKPKNTGQAKLNHLLLVVPAEQRVTANARHDPSGHYPPATKPEDTLRNGLVHATLPSWILERGTFGQPPALNILVEHEYRTKLLP